MPDTILQTNDPEVLLEDCVHRLFLLDEEILALQQNIDDLDLNIKLAPLLEKQAETRRELNALSPCGRLPPEIWQEIFRFTIPAQIQMGTLATDKFPWVLGRVCSRWRTIAWDVPEIWRIIAAITDAQDTHIEDSRFNYPLSLLQILLERSGRPRDDEPLHVWIMPDFNLSADLYHPPLNFCATLAASSQRWITLESDFWLMRHLIDGIQDHLPRLERLSLSNCAPTYSLFEEAPQLRSLTLNGVPEESLFPWAQITHFSNRTSRPEEHAGLLARLTNVVECVLEVLPASDFTPFNALASEDDIQVPSLRILTLCAFGIPPWLVTPSLRELTIDSEHITNVDALLLRSGCDLQKLTVRLFDTIPTLESLRCTTLPALQLDVFDPGALDDICALLTIRAQDAPNAYPLPSLETLMLSFDRSRSGLLRRFDANALRSMIESRWDRVGCARLGRVHFVGENFISADIMERVERLRASLGSGLVVSVFERMDMPKSGLI
ncbi:hypothetical protein C8R44DRAFT_896513 [Mycena epipterygia]|nr:hypothetical protein C8R44DRAFT_896513 [Mycena epipterygia]